MEHRDLTMGGTQAGVYGGRSHTTSDGYVYFDAGTITSALTGETAHVRGYLLRPHLREEASFTPAARAVRDSQERGIRWAEKFELIRTREAAEKLDRSSFAYNFQYALRHDITDFGRDLVTDLVTWYFFVDDVIDEGYKHSDLSPEEMYTAISVLAEILHGKHTRLRTVPRLRYGNSEYGEIYLGLCGATMDIMHRLRSYPADHSQFAQQLALWLKSIIVEHHYHKTGADLPELSYLDLRSSSIGMHPMYEIGAIVNGLEMAYARVRTPLNRLRHLAVMLVVVINDIVSLAKELQTHPDHEVYNLITIRHRALVPYRDLANPLQLAISRSIDLFNTEMLRLLNALTDPALARLMWDAGIGEGLTQESQVVAMLFNGVITNLDWHLSVPRYGIASGQPRIGDDMLDAPQGVDTPGGIELLGKA